MTAHPEITAVLRRNAIHSAELTILCKDFDALDEGGGVYFDIEKSPATAASRKRIIVRAPPDLSGDIGVTLVSHGQTSEVAEITIADQLADTMHFVGNPAVDP